MRTPHRRPAPLRRRSPTASRWPAAVSFRPSTGCGTHLYPPQPPTIGRFQPTFLSRSSKRGVGAYRTSDRGLAGHHRRWRGSAWVGRARRSARPANARGTLGASPALPRTRTLCCLRLSALCWCASACWLCGASGRRSTGAAGRVLSQLMTQSFHPPSPLPATSAGPRTKHSSYSSAQAGLGFPPAETPTVHILGPHDPSESDHAGRPRSRDAHGQLALPWAHPLESTCKLSTGWPLCRPCCLSSPCSWKEGPLMPWSEVVLSQLKSSSRFEKPNPAGSQQRRDKRSRAGRAGSSGGWVGRRGLTALGGALAGLPVDE